MNNYSLTGAQIIVRSLEKMGVTTVTGIPGGANLPLYDALQGSSIRHILARHEQGAGFIAQGMARSTGKPAVCIATSGPGAVNLLTAIADAHADSVPIIAITGQVPTGMIGTDAFQEVDIYGMALPVTKHIFMVRHARELPHVINEAFRISLSGRPGPVLIDIPKDVQQQTADAICFPGPPEIPLPRPCSGETTDQIARMIDEARRPLIYAGGGIIASDASHALGTLARRNSIPVALSLMGLGSFSPDDPLFLGMLGMHGDRSTNLIVEESDLLVAVGVRFDDRATGKVREFCRHASIVHIDIDHSEIDKIKKTNLSLIADARSALTLLADQVSVRRRRRWISRIDTLKKSLPGIREKVYAANHPLAIIQHAGAVMDDSAIITTDVGQHQMWTAQMYPFRRPRGLLTSGGLGTMGFGLPAAIGAALANPGRNVLCISGDGSFLMNLQELATLADLNLNVKVLIMNNNQLGLVRQQQSMFYNSNFFASQFISKPDFARIGEGFGIRSINLDGAADPISLLSHALNTPGPCVINVPLGEEFDVLPIVPPGASNIEMIGGELYE
ncbi:MAG: acetolactate synthase, large subunit, biosynthetic type [Spirochaetae bacterium HGW-Spirochaetae-1]|jgi:acetolactate synthase-1/2/3 large subunit|nr:MAG: acetolactate synthase, large subunit, biosynthetic type [Spirochaetae bacterium HGW-Spirochaetae-1]